MQTENTSRIPDDEIDLSSMATKIYSFFTYPVKLLFSNVLISCLFILAALIFSVSFKYLTPKVYTSSFIIKPTDSRDRLYLKVLSDIPMLIRKGDKKALAELLKLDTLITKAMVDITINPSIKNSGDSTNTVEIIIAANTNSVMLPLQAGILNFLENNPYFQKFKELQKKQLEMNLELIDKELIQLDSLKRMQLGTYEKQKSNPQSSFVLNDLINPVAAYNASSERMAKKNTLLAQKSFLERFMLIKGVVNSGRHTSPPRILFLLLISVPCSLILCVFFFHIKRLNSGF